MKKNIYRTLLLSLVISVVFTSFCFSAEQTASRSTSYIIGSGDILDIMTWKEPDFSREEVLVRTDGKISFPIVNDIQASGRTTEQLKNELEAKLKDYIASPVVTVTIKNPGSQKFYILGEIARTGEYGLTKNLTVLQAFALAGGFTQWASKNEILLLRDNKIQRINYKSIIKGDGLSDNIVIKADDTIIVP